MEITKKLIDIFKENGIYINDLMTEKIILDSIQFVSIIVNIETEFCIEIEQEYLSVGELVTFEDYRKMVSDYLDIA